MNIFQNALDFLNLLFMGAFFKRAHKDYFDPSWSRWRSDTLTVWMPEGDRKELKPAWDEVIPVLSGVGVVVLFSGENQREIADIEMLVDKSLSKGGWTHFDRDKQNPAVMTHAIIRISANEKGKDRRKIAVHEIGHALMGDIHSSDSRDVMHSPVYVTKLSKADKATLLLAYKNRVA
jgi:predicted Zn-dependent protease